MRIFNIGSLNIDYVYKVDHFVNPGETLASQSMDIFPGGKGLNQSIALARAGAEVVHCGIVGENGRFLIDILSDSGVNTDGIIIDSCPTGHAIIQVDGKAQNSILLFPGANHKISRKTVEGFLSDAAEDDILLIQNETNCLNEIFEIAAQKRMQIAFNPSPFDKSILDLPLQNVKWWFCNEIEGAELFGSGSPEEICALFLNKYPSSNLVLTLGKDGARFCSSSLSFNQPIFESDAVDTTAAGDTFTGYFMSAISAGKDIPYAMEIASKAASIAVSRHGASTSIPYINEIEKA